MTIKAREEREGEKWLLSVHITLMTYSHSPSKKIYTDRIAEYQY